jgi:hypothetical protein
MTGQWAAGIGATEHDFGANSVQSQQMASAYGLQQNVQAFAAGGSASGVQGFGLTGLLLTGLNPTAQFVGSYHFSFSRSGNRVNATITNSTTAWSAFYHVPGLNPRPPTRTGWLPMGRVNQTFHVVFTCS